MADTALSEQALEITTLLPRIMRRLFSANEIDPALELPVGQVKICSILRDGPRPISCVSRELGITVSAITQIADRLERAGLVERVPEEEDRRVRSLRLTRHGEELMKTRLEMRARSAAGVLGHLPPDERASLLNSLHRLLSVTEPSGIVNGDQLDG